MAALTTGVNLTEKEGKLLAHPVVASDVIYKGALLKHNAAGYLAPMAAESGAFFAGIAYETVDNSAGSAGDVACKVMKVGTFLMVTSGMAQADVGSTVYASDDATFSTTQASNEVAVGVITEYVSATSVWVRIDNFTV